MLGKSISRCCTAQPMSSSSARCSMSNGPTRNVVPSDTMTSSPRANAIRGHLICDTGISGRRIVHQDETYEQPRPVYVHGCDDMKPSVLKVPVIAVLLVSSDRACCHGAWGNLGESGGNSRGCLSHRGATATITFDQWTNVF